MSGRRSERVARVACLLLGIWKAPLALATNDALSLPQQPDAPVRLTRSQDDGQEPADLLQIFVGTEQMCCEDRVAIAGRYQQEQDALTFTPAFGFVPGTDYVARIRTADGGAEWIPFRIPAVTPPPTAAVTDMFPSADTLPENTLRLYLHFSVPMAPHVAFDHIALRDASGAIDDAAFMQLKQELWSEDRTRLTVLIDPGRIKREVATNVALGPALEAGHTYHLTVAGGWPSADGTSELAEFSRAFSVSPPLRERPDVRRWSTTSPCVGTHEALEITLDRPFDRHRLRSSLQVLSAGRQDVRGTVEVGEGERTWRFVPDEPWADGDTRVVVDPTLEDVAGNNFRDLLDAVTSDEASAPLHTSLPVRLRDCREGP